RDLAWCRPTGERSGRSGPTRRVAGASPRNGGGVGATYTHGFRVAQHRAHQSGHAAGRDGPIRRGRTRVSPGDRAVGPRRGSPAAPTRGTLAAVGRHAALPRSHGGSRNGGAAFGNDEPRTVR